jgi:hypothetical protein
VVDIFVPQEIVTTEVAHMATQMGPPLATSMVIQGIIDLVALITHTAKSAKQRATLLIDVKIDMIMQSHQHTLLKPFLAAPQIGTLTSVPPLT